MKRALDNGADYIGITGYCMSDPGSGLSPLYRYWNEDRHGVILK
jgi:hypothetical protein